MEQNEKPRVWIKEIAGQAVVQTRNDVAEDVRAALQTVGLTVNASIPIDVRSNMHQFVVTMDGNPISVQNVRVLLKGNDDVVLMDE